MHKLTARYRELISLAVLTMTFTGVMGAEFVVQTNFDSGGGQTINEINPGVFTIDTLRSAIEQANDETNFPGPDIIRFDENIVTTDPGLVYTTITLSQTGDQFDFQGQISDSALGINSVITIQGTLPDAVELPIQLKADGLRHIQVNSGGRLRLFNLYLNAGETPLNSAGRGGAVVVLDNGKLEINNSRFSSNNAVNGGALAFQSEAQDSLIQNSLFSYNNASDDNPGTSNLGLGGAIYADSGTNQLTIENTQFNNNTADASGGVMYTETPFEILNSVFEHNDATSDGGAVYAGEQAQFTISNSVFFDNVSQLHGGAIYLDTAATNSGVIFNSTLNRNGAGSASSMQPAGGGIYSSNEDNLLIHNSIIAGNRFNNSANGDDVSAELLSASSFNLIGVDEATFGISHNNNGNLIGTLAQPIEPMLIVEGLFGFDSVTGLESNSPAVNSGSNAQVTVSGLSTDVVGNDRVIGLAVDRGAHESDVLFYDGFE